MNEDRELRTDPADRPPAPPRSPAGLLVALSAVVVAGVVAAWIWRAQQAPAASPSPTAPIAPVQPPASAVATQAPAVRYPLPTEVTPSPALRVEEIPQALADLLGAKAVSTFLHTDGFARRVVATIDNLGREHAPPAVWPLVPTPGRFTVEDRAGGPVIAAENPARYTHFVLLAGTLDVPQTVRLYQRMYPLLQQAYRDLGFGDRQLNDRVVGVIDLLLATPEPTEPPQLELTEVKGPVPSTRPWVRYRFADPQLEQLASGQKILVRVGAVNERRLKAKLAELREQIVAAGTAAATAAAAPGSAPAPAAATASAPASTPAATRRSPSAPGAVR